MRRVAVPCAVALAVLTLLIATRWGPLIRLDTAVSDAARRFTPHHDGWRSAMSAVAHSADTQVLLPVALVPAAVLLLRRWRTGLLFLLDTAITATAIRLTILTLLHRPRPVDRLTPTSGWAFPSGHTTSSAVTAGIIVVLGWAVLTGRRSRLALVASAGGWAVLVGVSRVALLAHWPTDVLGGWLLASAVTVAFAHGLRVQRSFSTGRPASPHGDDDRSERPGGARNGTPASTARTTTDRGHLRQLRRRARRRRRRTDPPPTRRRPPGRPARLRRPRPAPGGSAATRPVPAAAHHTPTQLGCPLALAGDTIHVVSDTASGANRTARVENASWRTHGERGELDGWATTRPDRCAWAAALAQVLHDACHAVKPPAPPATTSTPTCRHRTR